MEVKVKRKRGRPKKVKTVYLLAVKPPFEIYEFENETERQDAICDCINNGWDYATSEVIP